MTDIAKLIGNKTSGYTSWLTRQLGIQARDFEEARLRGIREKRRKYERSPFDGTDEDKAYLLGLRHGDLSAYVPWRDVIRVSTSTTHPAMSRLFTDIFSPYGHVYRQPRYQKETDTYEWNLCVILDKTYDFFLAEPRACWKWISVRESRVLAYLSGLIDSEGSIGIYPAQKDTALMITIYNTNLELMRFVHQAMVKLGFKPLQPYLDKPKGFRSPGYHIEMKKDYWRVVVASFDESQALLAKLELRHGEKVAKQQLALSLTHREPWLGVKERVEAVRMSIRQSVERFREQARSQFLKRHPRRTHKTSSGSFFHQH